MSDSFLLSTTGKKISKNVTQPLTRGKRKGNSKSLFDEIDWFFYYFLGSFSVPFSGKELEFNTCREWACERGQRGIKFVTVNLLSKLDCERKVFVKQKGFRNKNLYMRIIYYYRLWICFVFLYLLLAKFYSGSNIIHFEFERKNL